MDSFGQEPNSDYDYPIATKKSIWNLNRSINDDKNQINFPLINGNEKNFESKNQQQIIFAEKKPILPAKNKSSNINHEQQQQQEKYAQSFYYDIPKNTPIKSSSSTRNLMTMSASTSSLSSVATTNNNSLMNNNRPQLPKKSSFVRKKIQKNYNDDNNYENLPESTINTLNRYKHQSKSISSSMMMDQTKSLTLPRPMKNIPATTTISPSIVNKSDYKPMNLVNNDGDSLSSTSKIINLSKADSDDDDDGCDYEYDYVCLESKKKLNNDDERIKILLPTANQYQIRYENLVIRSNDQQLPVLPVQNDNNFQSMKQFYRRHVFGAQQNFHQWTAFTIEIINHHNQYQTKPEIYFNFVKHILLAGQNLLNIFKLYLKQWKKSNHQQTTTLNNNELDEFFQQFLDQLKLIVMKTKRLTFVAHHHHHHHNTNGGKVMFDLIEQIQLARKMSEFVRKMF
ncbi:uncharacterized protein LOC113794866 isoform X2 [Dermatophagoides pteronyssinus]|uniref:uncharacterized protein LOC113794866 isoform X2 n=1 Tax=Dermatophagoides pteronyssinus TaxID=6956 RepID=UPI003F6692FC